MFQAVMYTVFFCMVSMGFSYMINNGDLSKKKQKKKQRIKLKPLLSLNFSTTSSRNLKDKGMASLRVGSCICFRLKSVGYLLSLCRFLLCYMNSICCTITAQLQLAVQLDYLITHPVGLGSK